MKKDSLGNRMKMFYENRTRTKLTRRTPVIMRLDGKAFHTLTRSCAKPFDTLFRRYMVHTAQHVFNNIQGAKLGYIQSDEISLLITDFDKLTTDAWFDYNIQKMCSIAASYASVHFTQKWGSVGLFDCRVFNIPKEEVCNYFIWRQKDWERNSLQMLARTFYTHKELHKKNTSDIHEMLHKKGYNWAKLPSKWKNGNIILKDSENTKTFIEDRDLIERYLYIDE